MPRTLRRRTVLLAALLAMSTAPAAAAADEPRDVVARALDFTVTIEDAGIYGAGVLVAPAAGLVLTAEHVVADMRAPTVVFHDGRTAAAAVVETDHALDLALLRVPPQPGAPPVLGDATLLRPGDPLYAVGCPRHLGFTVSRGVVSFVGRPMDGARFLQTDLPINDGNSGGPVIDARGALVGVMSFILRRAQGLSFALPSNYAALRFPRALPPPDPDYLARFRAWLAAPAR